MKKRLAVSGITLLVLLLLAYGAYNLMNSRSYQLFGELTYQIETTEKVAALTFDDGPTANTDRILQLLDKYNAKATFFIIGSELEQHPEEGRKMAEAGHELGNHTYSHKRMILKSQAFIQKELDETNRLIRETGYEGTINFRPPNGKKLLGLPYYLSKQHTNTIMWGLEPDSLYSSAEDKSKYVKDHISPGAIILLHPMYDQTGKELIVIEGILQALSEQGYSFVTVNELLNQ